MQAKSCYRYEITNFALKGTRSCSLKWLTLFFSFTIFLFQLRHTYLAINKLYDLREFRRYVSGLLGHTVFHWQTFTAKAFHRKSPKKTLSEPLLFIKFLINRAFFAKIFIAMLFFTVLRFPGDYLYQIFLLILYFLKCSFLPFYICSFSSQQSACDWKSYGSCSSFTTKHWKSWRYF